LAIETIAQLQGCKSFNLKDTASGCQPQIEPLIIGRKSSIVMACVMLLSDRSTA